MPTQNLSYNEFQEICQILLCYARVNDGDERETMAIGGIIRCAENVGLTISAEQIIEAVRYGLLTRKGQGVTITELGEAVANGGQAAWVALTPDRWSKL
jgi:hypothetical protein